ILCVKLLRPEGKHDTTRLGGRILHASERAVEALDHAYERLLERVLTRRKLVIAGTLGAFVASCFLVRYIGKDFFPETDESQFSVFLKLPVGTRLEVTEEAAKKMEQTILEAVGTKNVRTIVTASGIPTGRSALFTANTGPHAANIQVNLVPPADRQENDIRLMERVRKLAFDGRFAGMNIYFFNGGIVKRILNFGSNAPI